MPRVLHDGPVSPRRAEVLDGLERAILAQGFRSLRLTAVAKELGTSYATLYQLAATKDELVLLVVDRFFHRAAVAAVRRLEHLGDPRERLELWTSYGVAGVAATTPQFWKDVESHAGIAERVSAYREYYVDVLEAILLEGIARGTFRSVDTRLLAVMWQDSGPRLADVAEWSEGRTLEQVSQAWVDIVLHGVLKD